MSRDAEEFQFLVGMTYEEGVATLKSRDMCLRVTSEDDECFAVTADFRLDRVNVAVDKGLISHVSGLG